MGSHEWPFLNRRHVNTSPEKNTENPQNKPAVILNSFCTSLSGPEPFPAQCSGVSACSVPLEFPLAAHSVIGLISPCSLRPGSFQLCPGEPPADLPLPHPYPQENEGNWWMQPKRRPRGPYSSLRWKVSPLTTEESESEESPSCPACFSFSETGCSACLPSTCGSRCCLCFLHGCFAVMRTKPLSLRAKQIGNRCPAPWLQALLCIGTGAPQLLPRGSWVEPQGPGPGPREPPSCGAACSQQPGAVCLWPALPKRPGFRL